MDGWREEKKEKYMMQKTDTRDEWTEAVQNTFVCQNRGLCVRQRERLMDGLVYTARGVQGGGEGEICVLRGGHGWGDVIDLTGPVSPEEREIQMDG